MSSQSVENLTDPVKTILRVILTLEPIALLIIVAAFWSPDLNRLHTLWLMLPILVARVLSTRRLFPASILNGVIIVLLGLSLINLVAAPYSWGAWVIGRLVMGALLATSLAERVRRNGDKALHTLLTVTAILAIALGVIGLLYSQWTVKSIQLQGIIDLLPPAPEWEFLRSTFGGGFNVNEISGAMAWLAPVAAAIAIVNSRNKKHGAQFWLALSGFGLLALALFLAQSRMAIVGVFGAMGVVIIMMIPRGRNQIAAFAALGAVVFAEVILLTGIFNPIADQVAARDEDSLSSRVLIWQSGIDMMIDYPLTGIGMNQYRARPVRALYPVPGYETKVLPHAHNEWVQIGADLGVPGVLTLTSLYVIGAWRLIRAARRGYPIAWGIGAGLLAHAIFGLGDAITLFDRFIFLFWWLIGLTLTIDVITFKPLFTESPLDVELIHTEDTMHSTNERVPV